MTTYTRLEFIRFFFFHSLTVWIEFPSTWERQQKIWW